jgi:diguanylate cyclase (GGDEF)-like protein
VRTKLAQVMEHDDLTSLFNPAGFDLQLDQRVQKVQASGGSFCVLYLGIDNFGQINDGFGKATGDRLLVEVSRRVMAVKGVESQACRVAGCEYAFIVNGGLAMGRMACCTSWPNPTRSMRSMPGSPVPLGWLPTQTTARAKKS